MAIVLHPFEAFKIEYKFDSESCLLTGFHASSGLLSLSGEGREFKTTAGLFRNGDTLFDWLHMSRYNYTTTTTITNLANLLSGSLVVFLKFDLVIPKDLPPT